MPAPYHALVVLPVPCLPVFEAWQWHVVVCIWPVLRVIQHEGALVHAHVGHDEAAVPDVLVPGVKQADEQGGLCCGVGCMAAAGHEQEQHAGCKEGGPGGGACRAAAAAAASGCHEQ